MENRESRILQSINQLIAKVRSIRRKTALLIAVALSSVSGGLALFLPIQTSAILVIMTVVLVLGYFAQLSSSAYKNINAESLFEHLNFIFPEFEQSSQLLADNQPNSILQKLQKQKVETLFMRENFNLRVIQSFQPVQYQTALKILLISIIIFLVQKFATEMTFGNQQQKPISNDTASIPQAVAAPTLLSSKITIKPLSYMQLPTSESAAMNIHINEGSTVQWDLTFSRKDVAYFMVDTEGYRTPLESDKNGLINFEKKFMQTSLYSFAYRENGELKSLDNIYTIEVILDEQPKIKIIHPKQSLVEIQKQGPASFDLVVEITDDFGLSNTTIQASVASGSGEAVKFRDESFNFDSTTSVKNGKLFRKHWDLNQLKMEPGDEVYFKVISEDNKQPISQQTKSSSVIVRWLDNEVQELAAEGLRINFIPEYFRSQRQIIIETEQLIEDRKDLDKNTFDELSLSLGHSQSDLKSKYGQYLGDEVGEGPGEQIDGVEGVAAVDEHSEQHEDDDHDDHDEVSDEQQPEVGHVHDEMIDQNDRSGATELIARFAHNHGTTEIGPMSNLDPKSWMKKAVSEMWQAELHLMLSEPEKALDYEYKAYDYLKLATAAERVYVKRLGFEPPPVNEDTRLTGDLNGILSYSKAIEDIPDEKSDTILFQRVYNLLSSKENSLQASQRELLIRLKQRLLDLSETRPALIKQAATTERILTNNSPVIKNCTDCISQLKQKLWQLMPDAMNYPNTSNSLFNTNFDAQYQTKIQLLKRSNKSNQSLKGEFND